MGTNRRQLPASADTKNAEGDRKRPDPTALVRSIIADYEKPTKPCFTCNLKGDAAECLAAFIEERRAGKRVPAALVWKTLRTYYGYGMSEGALRDHLNNHVPGWND
jgi:hypothetical protein